MGAKDLAVLKTTYLRCSNTCAFSAWSTICPGSVGYSPTINIGYSLGSVSKMSSNEYIRVQKLSLERKHSNMKFVHLSS